MRYARRTWTIAAAMGALGWGLTGVAPAGAAPAIAGFTPPTHTPAQVNASVAKGAAYLDKQQNSNGSFGTEFPVPETSLAIVSYGILDGGQYSKLPAAMQPHLVKAVNYLLGTQIAPGMPIQSGEIGSISGAFDDGSTYYTYETGLALSALSFSATVPATGGITKINAAIAAGRKFLLGEFQAPPNETC